MKSKLTYNILLLLLLQCFFSSCGRIILNNLGAFEKNMPLKYITNGEKKIAFFSMHHIGTRDFYEDTKNKIDSFIKLGYKVYYEAVHLGPVKDSLQKDTIYRKARKITGVDFVTAKANAGYIDTLNNTILGKKTNLISKYDLINQPRNLVPKSDTVRVKNVDATFLQLINECEKKFGPIVLEIFDLETKFGEKYKFKKNKEINEYFLYVFRNHLIAETILNDSENKIIIVFGGLHFKGILEKLQTADKNYRQVEKL